MAASHQDDRQFCRSKPAGTSKTKAIVARVIHLQDKAEKSPTPLQPTGVRAARTSLPLEIPAETTKPLATRTEKPLPGVPDEYTHIDRRVAISSLDLFPHGLEIKKKREPIDFAQRIDELTRQNGYLLAELAYLKDTQIALKELKNKTREALGLLEVALHEVSHRTGASDQRLRKYWSTHSGDASEEVTAF